MKNHHLPEGRAQIAILPAINIPNARIVVLDDLHDAEAVVLIHL